MQWYLKNKNLQYIHTLFTTSFNFFPALNFAITAAGIFISTPVRGLRPMRAARFDVSKEPKFTIDTFPPLANVLVIASTNVFTAASAATFEISACAAIKSTNSCLFMFYLPFPCNYSKIKETGVSQYANEMRNS